MRRDWRGGKRRPDCGNNPAFFHGSVNPLANWQPFSIQTWRGARGLAEAKGQARDRMDGEMPEKEAGIPLPDSRRSSGRPIFPALVLK